MGRIKKAIRNLSIKKTFMLYMLLFLLLAAALSSICITFSSNVRNNINVSYTGTGTEYQVNKSGSITIVSGPPVNYTKKDKIIIDICDTVEIWSIPFFFGSCIIISALLFYRNKLKKPIGLLNMASEKIASNNLDFHLLYDSKDEMGHLCTSFETMRKALKESNQEMWRSMEERKRLNAAFSHDLRTPLTVLRGYSDFLKNYTPQGKISQDKLVSTLSKMSGQITRLENYTQMMSEVQRLEDINISIEKVDVSTFLKQLKNIAQVLSENSLLKNEFICGITEQEIFIDPSIILQVYENLLSNAVQYTQSKIQIQCSYEESRFSIIVSDDGKGFTSEDLKQADKPYYRGHPNTEDSHFGLGLTICKILCEKHNGYLLIENSSYGGARVTASFKSV